MALIQAMRLSYSLVYFRTLKSSTPTDPEIPSSMLKFTYKLSISLGLHLSWSHCLTLRLGQWLKEIDSTQILLIRFLLKTLQYPFHQNHMLHMICSKNNPLLKYSTMKFRGLHKRCNFRCKTSWASDRKLVWKCLLLTNMVFWTCLEVL